MPSLNRCCNRIFGSIFATLHLSDIFSAPPPFRCPFELLTLLSYCQFVFSLSTQWNCDQDLSFHVASTFPYPTIKKKIHSSVILFEQSYCTCAVSNNRNNSCIRNRQVHSCLCSEIKRSQVQENPWEYIQLHTPTVARQQRRYIKAMYTICTNMSHCRQANW